MLAVNTAKVIAWDQFFGFLDRLIFYPILLFFAINYGWFICFAFTVPLYFVYSVAIVTVNFRAVHKKGLDLFGIHAFRTIAISTRPPVISVCRMIKHTSHHYYLVNEALMDHDFDIAKHIVVRFSEKIGKKILSWILNNNFMLYVVGTLVVLDPQSVFMFSTQKCENGTEFAIKIVSKLFPMVCWHILYWSGVATFAAKGFTLLWEL